MGKIRNEYSLSDKITLAWWLLRTKLMDRRVRLFRFPLYVRGRRYIDFGYCLTTGVGCRFEAYAGNRPDNNPKTTIPAI